MQLGEKRNGRVGQLSGGQKQRLALACALVMEEAERLCDRVAIADHGKVIALGTPRHLIASLGAQHIIEFSLGEDQPSLTDAELLRLDGALSIQRQDDSYFLEAAQTHRTIPALLVLLGARGLQLARLRTHSATLEDVFVHLTGRTLRDG
jgi:ABC-2 type transport system ATP-binding protein